MVWASHFAIAAILGGAVVVSAATAEALTTTVVPVIVCPTGVGVNAPPAPVPGSTSVPISDAHLVVYSSVSGAIQLLGPKGSSCQAGIGADGNSSIFVVPAWGDTQTLTDGGSWAAIYPACVGCMWSVACPFFPALAKTEVSLYGKCPAQPLGQVVRRLRADAVGFYDPPGESVPPRDGDMVPPNSLYPTNGVVIYATYSFRYKGQPETGSFAMAGVCVLPASEHSTCSGVLDDFVATQPKRYLPAGSVITG
jgi:hypothetical protein